MCSKQISSQDVAEKLCGASAPEEENQFAREYFSGFICSVVPYSSMDCKRKDAEENAGFV